MQEKSEKPVDSYASRGSRGQRTNLFVVVSNDYPIYELGGASLVPLASGE